MTGIEWDIAVINSGPYDDVNLLVRNICTVNKITESLLDAGKDISLQVRKTKLCTLICSCLISRMQDKLII